MKTGTKKIQHRDTGVAAAGIARLSATVDPDVLNTSKLLARACGFRHSFSAYVNDALMRANHQRSQLLNAPLSLSPMR